MTSATSATSEGAQGIFSKITFLKSVRSNEKDEVCHSFVVKIFTKSLHRGGVNSEKSGPQLLEPDPKHVIFGMKLNSEKIFLVWYKNY